MKILVVTATFPPRKFGGITTVSYNISKKLVERGHDVTVYTTDLGDQTNSRLKVNETESIDGMNVYYFKNFSNSLAFKYRLFLPLQMMLKFKKNLNEFDIIHLHDFRSSLSILVQHYAKKYKIPYILQAHGSLVTPQKKLFKKFFDYLWGYAILRNATNLIAVSEREINEYKTMDVDKNKIKLVQNGIDISPYYNLPDKGEFRKNYPSLKINDKIILYLGRIHECKSIDLIIMAFADLLKDLDKVKLVIVGPDDGFLLNLKNLIKELNIDDKVLFTGPLYERDKTEAYVDADVFVSMRNDEIFGITFLEALASGTPVICSKEGGIANYINGIAGLSIEYDKEILKNELIDILTNEELKIRFGNNGKLLVNKRFNLDNVVDKFERIYLGLIGI
jgi:glycosyltransferase involved in cell wall biosynthesis